MLHNVRDETYHRLGCCQQCKIPRHSLFSNEEMRDMVCVYSKENLNGRRAHRRYLEMYSNRRQPGFKIFKNICDRLGETGSFRPKRDSAGRPKTLNPEQEGEILVRVAENSVLLHKTHCYGKWSMQVNRMESIKKKGFILITLRLCKI
ncbi:hypothetical protein NQ318_010330 [Aromia moschata]|uniref:DUF4817 domain-containing protein n=1 Tax=Aromia moschata TaxID=1265417 RepID=A0AAV8YIN8_9CUCU|nr:hypothetical protein NQ318_010330 [Aromia moschata]